jgi:hypothetical protein
MVVNKGGKYGDLFAEIKINLMITARAQERMKAKNVTMKDVAHVCKYGIRKDLGPCGSDGTKKVEFSGRTVDEIMLKPLFEVDAAELNWTFLGL